MTAPSAPSTGPPTEPATEPSGGPLGRRRTTGLSGHSARGVLWTLTGQWGSQVVRLVSIPLMSRLLAPSDFGLVASVTAITGFVATVGSLGLSEAVVQREKITQAQASALFWLNVLLGAGLTAVVAACAPLLAAFYGDPRIVGITLVQSTTFVLAGLIVQHEAMMLRQLNFRAVATRTFVSTVVGLVVSVGLALAGAGYWSLVAATVVQGLATVVVMWTAVKWRPSRPARAEGLRSLISYGGGVSTFRILDYASRNTDNILIGRFLGPTQLGLYARGYSLLMTPLSQIHGPVGNVVRPTMSALWPEPERYRRYYLSALSGLCYLVMPVVVVLAVLSSPVVEVMLGARYLASAGVFRWLAIAGLLQVIGYTNGWLYSSSGRSWAMARWALISRPILIASFVVGLPFGIKGVAMGYALSQLVLTPLGIARAGRGTPVSLRDVLGVAVRPLVLAFAAGGVALASELLVPSSSAVVQVCVRGGLAVLTLVLVVLAWPSTRRQVLGLLSSLRVARRRPGGVA